MWVLVIEPFLQEQQVLLTAEPPFQPHCVPVFKNYSIFSTEIVLTISICLLARMKESFKVDLVWNATERSDK